jgi:hypothetical protein
VVLVTSLGCNPSAGDINGALGTATATDACGVPTVTAMMMVALAAMVVNVLKQEHLRQEIFVVIHPLHHVL